MQVINLAGGDFMPRICLTCTDANQHLRALRALRTRSGLTKRESVLEGGAKRRWVADPKIALDLSTDQSITKFVYLCARTLDFRRPFLGVEKNADSLFVHNVTRHLKFQGIEVISK